MEKKRELQGIYGYDSKKGYDEQPNKECIYPLKTLLYMLDTGIFQQSIYKKNMNSYPGHKKKELADNSLNANKSLYNPENQQVLGKHDLKTGGFQNQRELRGLVKEEKYMSSRNQNLSNFSYGRF